MSVHQKRVCLVDQISIIHFYFNSINIGKSVIKHSFDGFVRTNGIQTNIFSLQWCGNEKLL